MNMNDNVGFFGGSFQFGLSIQGYTGLVILMIDSPWIMIVVVIVTDGGTTTSIQ